MSREPWTLQALLSSARMAPYLSATAGTWQDALALYDWNTSISGALFESLHYLEVGLRNALDHAASEHLDGDWLTSPSLLRPRSRQAVALAQSHAGGPTASHGKVVAELPFGSGGRCWQTSTTVACGSLPFGMTSTALSVVVRSTPSWTR